MALFNFDSDFLTPHGFCLAWDPVLLWLDVASDGLIAFAYYSIPIALTVFVLRRRDLAFRWVFVLFGLFILACGTTHLFDIWTLWQPVYQLQGIVKLVTALLSIGTAMLLWPLLPKALSLPSPGALRLANRLLRDEAEQREAVMRALEHETAERERAQGLLRQQQRMQAIGQLTSGVAHDFSNLLMVVQGNLEVLRARLGDDNALDRYIDVSLQSIQHANAVTGQLLSFARQQPLRPVAFDLNARLTTFAELLPSTLGESIQVDVRLSPELWWAEADPIALESALLNIVMNARDAMPDGGRLTIETVNATVDPEHDLGSEAEEGDYAVIRVTDTGSGMAEETRERAFEPFFTTKAADQASGLGLSEAYGFIRQSGGHMTLDSALGQGTRVTIHLRRFHAQSAVLAA